jgi:hypothetical protein
VFQGGGISAFIFAIYIDPLARVLNESSPSHRPCALLYADDIQLKPVNDLEAAKSLQICARWAEDYDMIWSIQKCAIVGNCESDLRLNGELIPRADDYRYLGAIHNAKGIDWRETYIRATAKQSRLLTALSDRNWHPRMRLIIYRTFLRPINEYTAVLAWIWAKKDLSSRSDLIKLMESSHQAALRWIFNRRRHLKLMDYMSGFGPWTHRMECLKAGLVFSLQKMHQSNPLLAARAFYMVSTSRHYILQDCFKSEYATAYLAEKNVIKKLTWFTWKNHQLESLRQVASARSATISYYFPVLNNDRSSPIFLLNWQSFDLAFNWRSNNILLHRTCSCAEAFNRAHLSCILGGNPLFDSTLAHRVFKMACLKVSSASQATGRQHQLTVLDHLLNRSKHADFLNLLKTLSFALDGASVDPSDPSLMSLQTQLP